MSFRRLVFLVAIAVVAVAGVAVAAKGGGGKVTLCAGGDGSLSAPKSGKCGKAERKLSVSKKGTPGPAGAPGPDGASGAPGAAGAVPSLAARSTLIGAAGPDCATAPVFCSSAQGSWGNDGGGWAAVSFHVDAAGGVHLQGRARPSFSEGASAQRTIFYLPAGLRPAADLTMQAVRCDDVGMRVYLRADGSVEAGAQTCVSLDGLVIHP